MHACTVAMIRNEAVDRRPFGCRASVVGHMFEIDLAFAWRVGYRPAHPRPLGRHARCATQPVTCGDQDAATAYGASTITLAAIEGDILGVRGKPSFGSFRNAGALLASRFLEQLRVWARVGALLVRILPDPTQAVRSCLECRSFVKSGFQGKAQTPTYFRLATSHFPGQNAKA